MSTDEIFTQRFRELCSKADVSQVDMASKLNMSQSAMSKLFNGKSKVSMDVLVKVADMLQTTTDYLLGQSDQRYGVIPIEDEKGVYLPSEVAQSYAVLEKEGKEHINNLIVYMAQQKDNQ